MRGGSLTLRWPVHDDFWCCSKPIAWFDSNREAAAFVNENLGKRNFYIGEPQYVVAAEEALTEVHGDPFEGRFAA